MVIRALFSNDKAILLENIAAINTMSCSTNNKIMIEFVDATSSSIARSWPSGTVLITRMDGCNAADERGVYVVSKASSPLSTKRRARVAGNAVTFDVSKSTLQDVVDELDISYGELVSDGDGKQVTSYTTTVTSYFTHSSDATLTSSVFVSTVTPTLTTGTYTSVASSTSISASSSAPISDDSGASSTSSSFALSPSAQAILNELIEHLPPPGPDGTITIPIEKGSDDPVVPQVIGSEPFNPDPEYVAKLESQMAADYLDSPETLANEATSALSDEESNMPANSPVKLSTDGYSGTPDSVYNFAKPVEVTTTSSNSKRFIPARAASAPAPRAAVKSTDTTPNPGSRSLTKRDGWDTFFDVMGDDLIGEICDVCSLM